jgi:hypothetical protein
VIAETQGRVCLPQDFYPICRFILEEYPQPEPNIESTSASPRNDQLAWKSSINATQSAAWKYEDLLYHEIDWAMQQSECKYPLLSQTRESRDAELTNLRQRISKQREDEERTEMNEINLRNIAQARREIELISSLQRDIN